MRKTKVLFLHSIPSPYRNPFFERFAKDGVYESEVHFMARTAKNRVWQSEDLNFRHKFLPGMTINLKSKDDIIPIWGSPTVPWEIFRGKFDVVICSGWDSLGTYLARLTCWFLGKPMIVWSGSTANEKSWRRSLMYWPVKLLVNSCSALISYGKASKDYLVSLGVKPENVFISYNSVDIDSFRKISNSNKIRKHQNREKRGIKNKHLIIFVGQLIRRKGVIDLYQVVQKLNKRFDVGILWVGHGPLMNDLIVRAKEDNFTDQYFTTTYSQKETAAMYSLADVFVLPTYEDIFSNVVLEALSSGLPVVTTKENGVSVDYLSEGKNGYVVSAGDKKSLLRVIKKLLVDKKLLTDMSNNTWNSVKGFSYEENIVSFKKAINFVQRT